MFVYYLNINVQQYFIIEKIKSSEWEEDIFIIYPNKIRLINRNGLNVIQVNVEDEKFNNFYCHFKIHALISNNLFKKQCNIKISIEDNSQYNQEINLYMNTNNIKIDNGYYYCNLIEYYLYLLKNEQTIINTNTDELYKIYLSIITY